MLSSVISVSEAVVCFDFVNPRDAFYYNYEELLKYYGLIMLVGVIMIAYMVLR